MSKTPRTLPWALPGTDAPYSNAVPHPNDAHANTLRECIRSVREDFITHGGATAGFHALAAARVEAYARTLPRPAALVALPATLALRVGLWLTHRLDVPGTADIGRRVRITGRDIAIHPYARIGDDCVIASHAKVASPAPAADQHWINNAPVLGAGVRLGEGCCVIDGVTIGDNAVVGPYTTVSTNVAAGANTDVHQPHGPVHLRLAWNGADRSADATPAVCSMPS